MAKTEYTLEQLLSRCWRVGDHWIFDGPGGKYGMVGDPREQYVHRLVYLLVHGAIPDGLQVAHNCGVTRCAEPTHLEAKTPRQNMADKKRHGTENFGDRNGMRRKPERNPARTGNANYAATRKKAGQAGAVSRATQKSSCVSCRREMQTAQLGQHLGSIRCAQRSVLKEGTS